MMQLWPNRSHDGIGLLLLPVSFAISQWWASHQIFWRLPQSFAITDGSHYIPEGWAFKSDTLPDWIHDILLYGLYPYFLSFFYIPGLDWATAGTNSHILSVYRVQEGLLAAASGVFLCCAYAFAPGNFLKKIGIEILLGVFLLSPLFIVWPDEVLMESLTLTGLILCLSACIVFDADVKYSLLLVGFTLIVVIWLRDPLISFICLFVVLLAFNFLISQRTKLTAANCICLAALLATLPLGGVRASLIGRTDKYIQPLANVIQLRMLPDPERRAFLAAHGLALSSTVMQRAGEAADQNPLLFMPDSQVSPAFVAYRNWLLNDGFKTYADFLLTHPAYVARSILISPNYYALDYGKFKSYAQDQNFSILDLFSVPRDQGYWTELVPYRLSVSDFLLAPLGWLISGLYFVYVVFRYVAQTSRRRPVPSIEILALAAFVSVVPTYHADGLDIWRHSVPLLLVIYASFLIRAPEIVSRLFLVDRRTLRKRLQLGLRSGFLHSGAKSPADY